MISRDIVCLVSSRKNNGRCVAGKIIENNETPGSWIRPVSSRHSREISLAERRYGDGTDSNLLDIIRMRFVKHFPSDAQPENWLIDENVRWEKIGQIRFGQIHPWLDTPDSLWMPGESSYYGLNNRIRNLHPEQMDLMGAGGQPDPSLYLISVPLITLTVGPKAPEFGNMTRVIRGEFTYEDIQYRFDMKDPVVERQYRRDGQYEIENPVLCISRTEPLEGYSYKLIAAILHAGRFE